MADYKRLRDVPRQCSVCSAKEPGAPLPDRVTVWSLLVDWAGQWAHNFWRRLTWWVDRPWSRVQMAQLLRLHYSGWQIRRVPFPLKRVGPFWRWSAHCGDCAFSDAIGKPSFLNRVKGLDSWKGGQITIPFGGGS